VTETRRGGEAGSAIRKSDLSDDRQDARRAVIDRIWIGSRSQSGKEKETLNKGKQGPTGTSFLSESEAKGSELSNYLNGQRAELKLIGFKDRRGDRRGSARMDSVRATAF